ncbi:conserved hypothetical protein (plasmid) [Borreliella finlandensis]|uniref:Uncharacterized protein n=1 Tax=Borreliella finlandensis TaxID=498741 RepID=A0A806CJ61_9SPIR|nr:conserved hypothetical protein [Borreliella finlandensis]
MVSYSVNPPNEMLSKARGKYLEEGKRIKNLIFRDGSQEPGEEKEKEDIVEHIKEEVRKVIYAVPINVDNVLSGPVILNFPYYSQEKIEISQ